MNTRCEDILKNDDEYRSLLYHLSVIHEENHLKDWKIYYALDATAIYSMLNGFRDYFLANELGTRKQARSELTDRDRKDIFLAKLGYDLIFNQIAKDRIIILPPHIEEVTDILVRKTSRLLSKKELVPIISNVLEKDYEVEDDIPTYQMFNDIYFLYSEIATTASDFVVNYVNRDSSIKEKIQSRYSQIIHEKNATQEIDELSDKFHQHRQRISSDSNKRDAKAVYFMKRYNEICKCDKEIIVIVSGARSMSWILNWDMYNSVWRCKSKNKTRYKHLADFFPSHTYTTEISTNNNSNPFRLYRTPKTFILRDALKSLSNGNREKEVALTRSLRDKVIDYFQSQIPSYFDEIRHGCFFEINPFSVNVLYSQTECNQECKFADIEFQSRMQHDLHNFPIRDFIGKIDTLYTDIKTETNAIVLNEIRKIKQRVDQMIDQDDSFPMHTQERLFSILDVFENDAYRDLFKNMKTSDYLVIKRNIADAENLASRLGYQRGAIGEYFHLLIESPDYDTFIENLAEISQIRDDEENKSGIFVVKALLFFSAQEHLLCKQYIQATIASTDDKDLRYALFSLELLNEVEVLKSRLGNKIREHSFVDLIEKGDRLLDDRHHYVHHMFSLALLRAYKLNPGTLSNTLVRAIDIIIGVVDKIQDPKLKHVLLNNLAYAYYLQDKNHGSGTLLKAQEIVDKMLREINNTDDWLYSTIHTKLIIGKRCQEMYNQEYSSFKIDLDIYERKLSEVHSPEEVMERLKQLEIDDDDVFDEKKHTVCERVE